jgi:hypothetical protein
MHVPPAKRRGWGAPAGGKRLGFAAAPNGATETSIQATDDCVRRIDPPYGIGEVLNLVRPREAKKQAEIKARMAAPGSGTAAALALPAPVP